MSRTYRHRHLPVVAGSALKYVDARTHVSRRIIEARLESYYAHVLHGIPCLVGGKSRVNPGWERSHNRCIYGAGLPVLGWEDERNLQRALGWNYPVSCVGSHPWASWWVGGNTHKTYARNAGHRSCRQKTKTVLHRLERAHYNWDDAEDPFPHTRYEINPWDWD